MDTTELPYIHSRWVLYSPRELDVVECGMLLAVQETGVEAGMHSAAVITDGILHFSSTSLYAQHTVHRAFNI